MLLAVWDGKPGDGVGGTAGAVGEWRNAGFTVDVIALGGSDQLGKGDRAGADPAAKDQRRGVKVAAPRGGKKKKKKGLYANRYCLAIGIEDYHGEMWPPLGNTLNDAEEVSQVLEGLYGFDARILENEKATKANIAEAIEDTLGNEVGEDDLVVLFFAGHGHTIHKKGQEHGFIVPFDANEEQTSKLIRMDALVSWSTYLECRHILYVFDSCFSGILSLGAGGVRVAQDPQAAAIAIAAGTAEQPVLDGGGDGHSIFTHNLLQALEGVDDGETITATELYSYVRKRVKKFTTEQSPTLGQMPNHQGGEIELERFG